MNNNILEKLGSVHMIVSSSSQSLITYQQDVKEPIALIEKSRGSYLLSMLLFLYTGLMGMGKHVPIFCALMGGGEGMCLLWVNTAEPQWTTQVCSTLLLFNLLPHAY